MLETVRRRRIRFIRFYRLYRRVDITRRVALRAAFRAASLCPLHFNEAYMGCEPISTFTATHAHVCQGDPCNKPDKTIHPGQYITTWSCDKTTYTHMTCWPKGANK